MDQRSSRTRPDAVPSALRMLDTIATLLPFQRTAGDEFQGVLDSPQSLAPTIERLLRAGGWHIGVGLGTVEEPIPEHAREARGTAFISAREAVSSTRTAAGQVRVVGPDQGSRSTAHQLESVVWLWAALLGRRTDKGWEVADLVDQGLSYEAAGQRLGISQSAVSQRASAAGILESLRARELVTTLAERWLRP